MFDFFLVSYSFEQVMGAAAGLFGFLAFVLYYISILKGKTRPNRATWFILTVVGALIALSYYASGARETLWVPVSYVIGPFIAFLLSIKYGVGGWTPFDRLCLFGCFVSIIFWKVSHSPEITLFLNILIDFFGILPTIKKSYLDPLSEDRTAWSMTVFASVLNIFAVGSWTLVIGVYPVYMLFFNGLIVALLFFSPKKVFN